MAVPVEVDEIAASRLQRVSQRYTKGRRALVGALRTAGQPVSIPELLERDPGLPQSSAYRNLTVLESAGVVRRVVSTDEFTRFELAEDLTEHHHHLICSICGTVSDVTVPPGVEAAVDHAVDAVAKATGFVTDHHRLDLVGRCADCA